MKERENFVDMKTKMRMKRQALHLDGSIYLGSLHMAA